MNKKNFLAIVGGVLLVVMAVFNVYQSRNQVKLSELALENIEALARDESDGGKPCTIVKYDEVWYQGCLYNAAFCAEGPVVLLNLISCYAR